MEKQKIKGPTIIGKLNTHKLGNRTGSYKRKKKARIKFKEYIVTFNIWNGGKESIERQVFKHLPEARVISRQCSRNGNFVSLMNHNRVKLTI